MQNEILKSSMLRGKLMRVYYRWSWSSLHTFLGWACPDTYDAYKGILKAALDRNSWQFAF